MQDGSSELVDFAARCRADYLHSGDPLAWAYACFIVFAAFMMPFGTDQSPWTLLLTVPIGLFLAYTLIWWVRSCLSDAERKYGYQLKRHIRSNLFRHGLWLRLLEDMSSDSKSFLGLSLPSRRSKNFSDRLELLYWKYPELCTKMGLKPFSYEFQELLDSQPSQKFVDARPLWRLSLGEALMQELGKPHRKRD